MFKKSRVKIIGTDIFINEAGLFSRKSEESLSVINFTVPLPIIRVFENNTLLKTFNIETLENNNDLSGQYFHSSIRILENGAVMIDGIVSKNKTQHPNWKDTSYEGIRLQPFFLNSVNQSEYKKIIGKGVFTKGLHYSGTVSPTAIRVVCICDACNKSFTLEHFHAGFSEAQYFYSDDSKQTLIVDYNQIDDLPKQLQNEIDESIIKNIETKLPKPTIGKGNYRYYNSFRCPHCLNPFIDFTVNKEIRPNEYYGLKHINNNFQVFT